MCRISIIVPAHNAGADLSRCFEALTNASAGVESEIIVVDDTSTDGTAENAEKLGARVFRQERNSGPSAARNQGAANARGEILFFVDSDVVVHPDAVTRVLELFDAHPDIAAVFGSYDTEPGAQGTLTEYRNLVHHFVHQHGRSEASTFWAGCGAIRKKVFDALGGYDETGYPRCIEDIELGYRLREAGHAVRLDKELLCSHLKRWTLLSMIRTDIFCRALPWARLNRMRNAAPRDLNIKMSQKISVALTGLALLSLIAALFRIWFLVPAAIGVLLIVAINAGLFGFLVRHRGIAFALTCIPLHLLYFFYSGVSFFLVEVAWKLGIRLRDGNSSR